MNSRISTGELIGGNFIRINSERICGQYQFSERKKGSLLNDGLMSRDHAFKQYLRIIEKSVGRGNYEVKKNPNGKEKIGLLHQLGKKKEAAVRGQRRVDLDLEVKTISLGGEICLGEKKVSVRAAAGSVKR